MLVIMGNYYSLAIYILMVLNGDINKNEFSMVNVVLDLTIPFCDFLNGRDVEHDDS